ncbi:DUF934 domain-containing protein [Hydrogenophaga atypica]|uniref:DUF934 domain-containing protein n=1 Tax=Hydrogenophaga atypica TaxID=249409 RepID=A0ABW2QJX0_9BURK
MQLIESQNASQAALLEGTGVLSVANDTDVEGVNLDGVATVVLHFPKFTDGRAFSQAVELRRRRGFDGTVVATGDVLVDQLLQMKRCGFSAAVLRADQSLPVGEKLLRHYSAFYQGDAEQPAPLFARQAA